jgi:subtilisin-like proprotein convertase family protein
MKKSDLGRYLPRGGRKIKLDKVRDTFTAVLPRPAEAERLRTDEAVKSVEPLTRSVVKVTVAAEKDQEKCRDELMERLRQEGDLVVHHEYSDAGAPESSYRITDEIIVKFGSEVGSGRIGEILEQAGVGVRKHYRSLGQCYLVKVTNAAGANPVKVSNRLEAYQEVEYAEPCLVNRFAQFAFPIDEQFSDQWHLYSESHGAAPDIEPDADAAVYQAWQITKGSRDIVVAVLDDGFELSHPDFQGLGKVVEPVDFVGGDDAPLPGSGDYHGTPCAGVAVAEENGSSCVGVAPECAFMPVRFPLGGSDPWLIEIFEYVSQRAHVASCSWGMSPGDYDLHSSVRDTFAQLIRSGGKDGRGLVIVFAAGNYDAPLNTTVDYPIRWLGRDSTGQWRIFQATGRIVNGYPAHPDTIAVSACTSLKRKSLYSNWGREISVAAPSDNFDPTSYDTLSGRGITTTDNEYYGDDFTPGKRYTHSFGGTSSATPLVAGVAALVKSASPSLTALEIKDIIERTADKIEDPSTDPLYGHAKGTYQDGHSEWFGYGKVNALRAVQEAAGSLPVQRIVERENATAQDIPDNYAPGITSAIEISESGSVADIEVSADVTHTWIGDLEVSLLSPLGTRVLLHDRGGGRQNDIRRTYSVVDTPGLGAHLNQPAWGEWLLTVADRAGWDEGTLNRWRLKVALAEDREIRVRSTASSTIPDNDPKGIASQLSVGREGLIQNLTVDVDITHTWIGDLRVSLVAPSGREVILHGNTGGSADNIREVYDVSKAPGLEDLIRNEEEAWGVWTLKVADVASRDVGKLNSWGLTITLA